ncbi:MAG: arsenosugar biosynthesis radical SAM protein ArsS [Deltaproteobacteria bacterium]|nr:arsenosugar biosynthesis radical SAM protein ArsS [Deltaproteobacteria bacterium]
MQNLNPITSPADNGLANSPGYDSFERTLANHGLRLERGETSILQVNVGLRCNQLCRHCHLDAGPNRDENMGVEDAEQVVAYAGRNAFETIDITGGAPELNPNLPYLIRELSPLTPRLIIRSNLSALDGEPAERLLPLLKEARVVITASFPSINPSQAESQRGEGMFEVSIGVLQRLNEMGYGREGSGLELNLVSNPTGAFLPSSQKQTEERFKRVLAKKWDIHFNGLFTFGNVPLGRFHQWLIASDNYHAYMKKLVSGFNPQAVEGLMCRNLVSISWDGYLFDCDFNQSVGLFMGGEKIHISDMAGKPEPGGPITIADHCFTCTAGAGFT